MKSTLLFVAGLILVLAMSFQNSGCRKDENLYVTKTALLPDSTGNDTIMTDYDGNVYHVIEIGGHLWMAENLKVTHYKDGTPITYIEDDYYWSITTEGAFCAYNNDMANKDTFGLLYNWYTVNSGLAPEGWHVATEDDWKHLELSLGLDPALFYEYGFRGLDEGTKIAGKSDLWTDGILEYDSLFNVSNFNGLPGGRRYLDGSFDYIHDAAYWWSSVPQDETYAYRRHIWFDLRTISRTGADKSIGFSVRCVKNIEIPVNTPAPGNPSRLN